MAVIHWLLGVFIFTFCTIRPNLSTRQATGTILDVIDRKEVERIIAERQENNSKEEKRYLLQNELVETYIPEQDYEYQRFKLLDGETEVLERTENPRIEVDLLLRRNNMSDPFKSTELLSDLRGYHGRKVLKSSKNALIVTKKEYLKKDWCKTEPLVQKIKETGCLTRKVINRFCYGQCNSFYIPKSPKKKHDKVDEENEEEDLNGPAFKSCAFCKPKKFTWVTITLRCPSQVPQFKKKRIQRIKQCKCL